MILVILEFITYAEALTWIIHCKSTIIPNSTKKINPVEIN